MELDVPEFLRHMGPQDDSTGYVDPLGDPLDEAVARLRAGTGPSAEDIALLTEAARTAQRAFEEIGTANTVLDDASDLGHVLVSAVEVALARRTPAEIPPLLDALRAQAVRVERSEAVRAVANRVLGNAHGDEAEPLESVPALTADLLPRVPSVYDDEEEPGNSLADLWERQERLERVQDRVRQERVERVAAHLTSLATKIAARAFTDARFTRGALDEIDRAYALWCACLAEGGASPRR